MFDTRQPVTSKQIDVNRTDLWLSPVKLPDKLPLLSNISKTHVLFTPALLYQAASFDRDVVAQCLSQCSKKPDVLRVYDWPFDIFSDVGWSALPCHQQKTIDWNRRLYAVLSTEWADFRNFILGTAWVTRDNRVTRVFLTPLSIVSRQDVFTVNVFCPAVGSKICMLGYKSVTQSQPGPFWREVSAVNVSAADPYFGPALDGRVGVDDAGISNLRL